MYTAQYPVEGTHSFVRVTADTIEGVCKTHGEIVKVLKGSADATSSYVRQQLMHHHSSQH